MPTATSLRTVLNLGCGNTPLPEVRFPPSEWREIRVDASPSVNVDVVADITALPFGDGSADGVCCLACLEHVPEGLVGAVLGEIHRVLRPGGELLLAVPDLRAIAQAIVDGQLVDVVEHAPSGPIRPLDMLYGHAGYATLDPLMSHRTGFTAETLANWLRTVGFEGEMGHAGRWLLCVDVRKT